MRRFALLLLVAPLSARAQSTTALVNATVVDVERGTLVPNQSIIVAGDRIERVGPSASTPVPRGATRVDLRGRFVIPGLWDMHVHIAGNATVQDAGDYYGSLFLRNGVTGIRDAGGDAGVLHALDSIGRARPGMVPRLVYSGEKIGPRDGASWSIANVNDAIAARTKAGATYIKLVPDYPVALFKSTLEACAAARLRCVAHVPPADTSIWLSVPGHGSYEHVFNLGEHVSRLTSAELFKAFDEYRAPTLLQRVLYKVRLRTRPAEPQAMRLAERDTTRDAAFFGRVAASGTWITPTLVLFDQLTGASELLPSATDTTLAVAPTVRSRRSGAQGRNDQVNWNYWTGLVRALRDARVPMLAGTDFSAMHVPGAALHAELVLLQQAGLPAAEVLRMATLNPARYFGATDSLGSIAPRHVADLVVLRANPLEDVGHVGDIEMVMTRGRLLRASSLDSLTMRARASRDHLRDRYAQMKARQ